MKRQFRDSGASVYNSKGVKVALCRTVEDATMIATSLNSHAQLVEALRDLLGDAPFIQDGICTRCGRDYRGEEPLNDECADDCPGMIARAALAGEGEGNATEGEVAHEHNSDCFYFVSDKKWSCTTN
jgi:hypothetical protein